MRMQPSIRRQRGAALVVGLMLLLVLTLLAVSGMNTASTELMMAGNEQFQEGAFQAAETGIEQAMDTGAFNPGVASQTIPLTLVAGTTNDRFTTVTTPQPGINMPMQAMWGNRWDSFSTFHFQIQSQGTSARNAATAHVQGMFVIAPFDASTPPPLPGGPTALTP